MTTTDPLPDLSRADPQRPRWLVASAVTLALLAVAVLAAVIVVGDDDPATAAPLSQVQQSCADWMDSGSASTSPDDQWCTDMFAWMDDHSGGSMMGSMMWQGSEEMGRACRDWVTDQHGETGPVGMQRCDSMLEWMDGHMTSQGGRWMMRAR